MKQLMISLLSTFFSLNIMASSGDATELRARMEKAVKASGIPAADFSLYITTGTAETGAVILDVNANKPLIPASISKVATASAVLATFPPGTKFKTQLWIEGPVKDGTLRGNLYLKGGGDPSFVSENFWFLVNQFTRTGIQKIEGDLVVDDRYFDSVRYDESREENRVDRAYDAPVGAMSFNWNSINIFVRPGPAGGQANVFLDPENGYTRLVNKTKTTKGVTNTISVEREKGKDGEGDVLVVSGHIGVGRPEVVIYKNITRPDLWAGENLRSFLAQRKITLTGSVKLAPVPGAASVVAEAESKPVEQILGDMNKFSNNYVAEMLTKNLGARRKAPGTLAEGIVAINEHLKTLKLPADQFVFKNPSGLTRENRFSAFAMAKILLHLRDDFQVQPEFLTSLPIAGIDGTLKKRMNGSAAERWVRAKTGLLTGVTALAGYAGRDDGRVFTFVFIHNGRADEAKVRRTFDDWLITLLK